MGTRTQISVVAVGKRGFVVPPLGSLGPVVLAGLLLISGFASAAPTSGPGKGPTGGGALGVTLTASPVAGFAPLSVDYTLTIPANTTLPEVSWSFGDGLYLNGTGPAFLTPVHLFVDVGGFRTVATATWPSGAVNASLTISVAPANLSVALRANVTVGTAPLTVEFSATAAGGTGTFVSFLWSFGDGDSGVGPSVRYTFALAGDYPIVLTVTDSRGDAGAATSWVNVSAPSASNGSNSTAPVRTVSPHVGGSSPWGTWNRIVSSGLLLPALGISATIVALALYLGVRGRATRARTTASPNSGVGQASAGGPASGSLAERTENAVPGDPTGEEFGAVPAVPSEPDPRTSPRRLPSGLTQERQIANRTIRLLAELPRLAPGDTPGPERTQAGIVAALGAGQSAVSRVLGQLERAGVVSVQSTHVAGSSRQMKVYQLTPRGERLGFALREAGPRR
jgi:PKD domain-containing protein